VICIPGAESNDEPLSPATVLRLEAKDLIADREEEAMETGRDLGGSESRLGSEVRDLLPRTTSGRVYERDAVEELARTEEAAVYA
jgi:hypothetical protein